MPNAAKSLAWDDFRVIKAIAEARALPAAAASLGIDHSTVFRRLNQIERVLGLRLFDRIRTGYAVTAAGEEVVGLALRMDEEITALTRRIAGRAPDPSGELRVTTNDSLLIHLLTPLFAVFRRRYPRIRLDIVIGNRALDLSRRDSDVAIRATDRPPETLVGRRIGRIAWALYGRAQDFPEPGPVAAARLADRDWVALGDALGAIAAVRHAREQVAPERLACRIDTVLGLAEAVEAGLGIGHLPCFVGDLRPGLRRLGPTIEAFATDLWLLTHPDLRHAARIRAFLEVMGAELTRCRPLLEGRTAADDMAGEAAPA
ncbi:LysR family transcriptional regulator [Prosthecomicrobium hirschii]|uniref:LysR family transcriptional regulator n=1 Tax=Prosthecodimorpha hirschii TaxID=665126 RepID=UPI00222037AE|nr:LysR family transcriptional regulator [Prosthecomicrobium hirschii]